MSDLAVGLLGDVCDTCRKNPACWLAHHPENGDTWMVCNFCRGQALKFDVPVIHHPLP